MNHVGRIEDRRESARHARKATSRSEVLVSSHCDAARMPFAWAQCRSWSCSISGWSFHTGWRDSR
jgi:hypothetical protein